VAIHVIEKGFFKMPTMYEIYQNHATEYDELVTAEDHQDNLGKYLRSIINWDDRIVYEAGIGTGRVTGYFLQRIKKCYGFDREEHMLEKCRENHQAYSDKLILARKATLIREFTGILHLRK